jgi:hypothetical protein
MTIFMIARVTVDVVSAIFGVAGLINLSGGAYVRAIYRLWHYPPRFYRIVGATELMAALFLIVPETRIWGVFVSGMITFIATVTLLRHRQYLWSLPAMLLLMSLIPVSLAHTR